MADLPVTPLANYGQLLSAIPLADSEIASQNSQQNLNNAQIAQVQASTQGTNIANQGATLKLGLLQNYYAQNQPGAPQNQATSSGQSVGGTNYNQNDIQQGIQSKFAPLPTAPPPSAVQQDAYARSVGAPEMAVATYKAQVENANQQRGLGADSVYKFAQQVESSPHPMATFEWLDPQKAAAFKAQHPSDDPEQLDKDARLMAQQTGLSVHQYTGRGAHFENGVMVDDKDNKPVLGSQQILTGLDAKGKESAFASANEPVTIGNNLPQARYKTVVDPNTGQPYVSASAYVIAADKAARSSATNGQDSSGATEGPPTPTSGPTKAAAKQAAPISGPAATTTDPVLKTALSDTSYRWQQPFPKPTTQEQQAANVDAQKANIAAGQTLKTQSDQAVAAAASAQTYLQAAKAIIDSKGAAVGAYGGLIAKASAFVGDYKGDASNYQELSKYLNNAAIAAAKGNYGTGLTEKELELQLSGASPSVDKTPGALKELVEANLRNTKYTLDTANRVVPYLNKGNDPTNFNKWNQGTWSQSAAVNKPNTPAATPPTAGVVRGGYKFNGGDPSDKANWSKQ